MKIFELDKQEKQILNNYDGGKFKGVSYPKKEKKKLKAYIQNTLNKTRNINIRISEADLLKVKAKAL